MVSSFVCARGSAPLSVRTNIWMPFGGVGPSGIGSYHGPEGFKEFSHARSVYHQTKVDVAGLAGLKPPYGEKTDKAIKRQL